MAPEGSVEGNTIKPRVSASSYWFGTWNNYKQECLAPFLKKLDELCDKYIMQEEVGESGTPHLQLKIKFVNKGRPIECFGIKEIHWIKSKKWEGWQYCGKDETRAGQRWFKGCEPPPILEYDEPYGWQLEVVDLIKQKPDKRSVYWYWEDQGNFGKSSLCRYLVIKHEALVIGGNARDMKLAISKMKKKPLICILDVPRTIEHISYSGVEEIKNGVFFSSKCDSEMVKMNPPHIIIFSNSPPEEEKMSKDRWIIKKLR